MEHASKCDYIDFSRKGLLLLVKIKKTNIQQKSDLKSIASTPALPTLKNNLDKSYIPIIDNYETLNISNIKTDTSKDTTKLQHFNGKRDIKKR